MTVYIVAPTNSTGAGTLVSPWGIPDLFTTPSTYVPGIALTTLQPGDTLYFRGGTYNLNGPATSTVYPLIAPTHSGIAASPITFQPYPGEAVTLSEVSGLNPVIGTMTSGSLPTNRVINYVRFLGFTIATALQGGLVGSGCHLSGVGCEVAYCEFFGNTIATSDNHPGFRIDFADQAWIHHNYIHDVNGPSGNSCGTETYQSTNSLFEDNHIYNCTCGLHDKDCGNNPGGNNSTYRRNWVNGCSTNSFQGNNQNAVATYFIYDNVFDHPSTNHGVDLGDSGTGTNTQIYNNLLIIRFKQAFGTGGSTGVGLTTQANIWNNIVLFGGAAFSAYWANNMPYVQSGTGAPIALMDFNIYDGVPDYTFNSGNPDYNLAGFQGQGFEIHSRRDTAANIFVDQINYVLKGIYPTAGRFGDEVGPRSSSPVGPGNISAPNSTAQIINPARYGPTALNQGAQTMATWASLTPAQQAQVQQYIDQDLRPVVLQLARALAKASVAVIPQYLASPTGLTSTMAAPAADSVAGILATLSAGEVVPISTSGLPLAGPLLGSKVSTYSTALNNLLTANFSAAVQQDYAQIVGSINLLA